MTMTSDVFFRPQPSFVPPLFPTRADAAPRVQPARPSYATPADAIDLRTNPQVLRRKAQLALDWDEFYDALSISTPAPAPARPVIRPVVAEAAPDATPEMDEKALAARRRTIRGTSALTFTLTAMLIMPDQNGVSANTGGYMPVAAPVAAMVAPLPEQVLERVRAYAPETVETFRANTAKLSTADLQSFVVASWDKAMIPDHPLADFFHDAAILAEAELALRNRP